MENINTPTVNELLLELEQLSQQGVDTYSLADRQRVIQLRQLWNKEIKKSSSKAKWLNREKKWHKAVQMKLLTGTVKDRENEVEESEPYKEICLNMDVEEVQYEYLKNTLPVFSELNLLMRDAMKVVEEQTA